MSERNPDEQEKSGRGRSIVILVVVVALVAGMVWMAGQLRSASRTQDCMMAGRTNCATLQ
jgi:hypothetical protein